MHNSTGFITFPSSYHVLQAEKLFKEEGLHFSIVPIPREITSSCGMAIMYDCQDKEIFEKVTKDHKLPIEGFYTLQGKSSSGLWNKLMGLKK